MRFQTFQAEQKRYNIAVRVTISIIGGCICELKIIRFALRGHILDQMRVPLCPSQLFGYSGVRHKRRQSGNAFAALGGRTR